MNVLFLDYDGVVNTPMWDDDGKRCTFNFPSDNKVNNFQCVQWVSEFCQRYDYKISGGYGGNKMKVDTVVKIYEMLKTDCESKKCAADETHTKLRNVCNSLLFDYTDEYQKVKADFEKATKDFNESLSIFNAFVEADVML